MSVRFEHHLGDLTRDLDKIAADFRPGAGRVVVESAREGNNRAKEIARARYGAGHARKYAGTFSAARTGVLEAEYGPAARGQGKLASILERGSRNNGAHHNLDKSSDEIGPVFALRAADFADGLFWPGGDK
jgi:hypothetical protein